MSAMTATGIVLVGSGTPAAVLLPLSAMAALPSMLRIVRSAA
jgi:hypothetical protein